MAALPLSEWHDFYVMVGTASGAIIGAAFIVATLTSGMDKREFGIRGFITPTAVHLGAVLVGSAVLCVPTLTPLALLLIFGAASMAGIVYAGIIVWRIYSAQLDVFDRFWYCAAPVLAYLGIAASACWLQANVERGLESLAVTLVGLLIVGMHNLWDMATFMILREREPS